MSRIDMDNLPSNSETVRREDSGERKRLEPVVGRDAVSKKKKTLADRFEEFLEERDFMNEIIMPGIISMVEDCLEGIFLKNSRFGPPRRREYRDSYYYDDRYRDDYDYSRASYRGRDYDDRRDRRDRYDDRRDRDIRIDYREIVLKNRDDAERVVSQMRRRIRDYDEASVADLLDLVNVVGDYTDNAWGWTDPRDIDMRRVSNGYLIMVTDARSLRR